MHTSRHLMALKNKILIVEDDPDVLVLLQKTFDKTGEFETITASDGTDGLRMARADNPDAILLDLMLPGMTGFELCRVLKADSATKSILIIIVTAKADEFDRINGFELGADDYVVKPFSPREVLLRVKAVMRRRDHIGSQNNKLKVGPIVLDREFHQVSLDGKALQLTTTEFKLLAALVESRGRVLGRGRLLTDVWGYEGAFNTRTVDTHIRRLREKLGKYSRQIQTIRGFGYRMVD